MKRFDFVKFLFKGLAEIIGLFLIGASLGWLVGISLSPVVHIVITSLVGLVVTVISLSAGIDLNDRGKDEERIFNRIRKINVFPVAVVLCAVVVGATSGIYCRTNDLLGVDPDLYLKKWKNLTAKEKHAIELQILQSNVGAVDKSDLEEDTATMDRPIVPPNNLDAKNGEKAKESRNGTASSSRQLQGGLFADKTELCSFLQMAKGEQLRIKLKALNSRSIDSMLTKCQSDECIDKIKVLLCSQK